MPAVRSPAELFEVARAGDRSSLARLISLVERGGEGARRVGELVFPLGGSAYTVGVTGAPGSGKSTLTSLFIGTVRTGGDSVAVLAIDPTSPFTGGAILGDRVRMQDHALDENVFIRSMATRGHLGGLSLATPEAVRVLDAVGFDWVLLETVGVGQVEVEVAGEADTTVVVMNPGWGDAVQASKAGLLEVADVFVINKADRPGVDEARRDLQHMLDLAGVDDGAWRPPIVPTVGTTGDGIDAVVGEIRRHRQYLEASGALERRRAARLYEELRQILRERVHQRVMGALDGGAADDLRARLAARDIDPYRAADELLAAAAIDGPR